MRANKVQGVLHFLVKELIFAEFGIEMDLLEAGDAVHFTGVLIKDFVVARPELIGEVGANRNEAMELDKIANGPGKANENRDGKPDRAEAKQQSPISTMLVKKPAQQQWQSHAECGIGEKSDTPEKTVLGELARAR